jgi:EAL domain-containing protein (putative c-di-GMP-specific phosphodiesterase class I)
MRSAIRNALDKDELALYAQPVVDLSDDSIAQYELLLRMPLEDGRVLRASQFIGLAERSGLILAIDHWVTNHALRLLKESEERGHTFSLAVNLSAAAFEDKSLLDSIQANLRDLPVDPSRLIFEVTETAAVSNVSGAQKFICSLRELAATRHR